MYTQKKHDNYLDHVLIYKAKEIADARMERCVSPSSAKNEAKQWREMFATALNELRKCVKEGDNGEM